MSSLNEPSHPSRKELRVAVMQASQENSTTAVMFHTAIAEQIGLGATEEKTLLLLSKQGSLTAGEIAQHTGLTTSSVTSLLDRLESKGFVRRVHDHRDRRRILVEPLETLQTLETALFGTLQEQFDEVLDVYSDEQLATITDFLTRATQHAQEVIATLNQAVRSPSRTRQPSLSADHGR